MPTTPHLFGGDWTAEKLERVRKYLVAYANIMKEKRFRFAYIDAFAGTGYRNKAKVSSQADFLFPELLEDEPQEFIDGSVRIALQVEPRFHKYIFIELDPKRYIELENLRDEFPDRRDDIILVQSEANSYLKDLCQNHNWLKTNRRATLFLDPYGMQVTWETIEAIAATKAIDLWILFPLGIGVNRMTPKQGSRISDAWRQKLDNMFGETDWYEEFYRPTVRTSLFGDETSMEKVVNFDSISQYFIRRLKTIFVGVADNPRPLFNSRNNPLYLLCFAAGNPKGAPTAIKIAQDILRKD
jgi:three-Cys-motif partner protein